MSSCGISIEFTSSVLTIGELSREVTLEEKSDSVSATSRSKSDENSSGEPVLVLELEFTAGRPCSSLMNLSNQVLLSASLRSSLTIEAQSKLLISANVVIVVCDAGRYEGICVWVCFVCVC